jgi:hypothetical protein
MNPQRGKMTQDSVAAYEALQLRIDSLNAAISSAMADGVPHSAISPAINALSSANAMMRDFNEGHSLNALVQQWLGSEDREIVAVAKSLASGDFKSLKI